MGQWVKEISLPPVLPSLWKDDREGHRMEIIYPHPVFWQPAAGPLYTNYLEDFWNHYALKMIAIDPSQHFQSGLQLLLRYHHFHSGGNLHVELIPSALGHLQFPHSSPFPTYFLVSIFGKRPASRLIWGLLLVHHAILNANLYDFLVTLLIGPQTSTASDSYL